MKTITKREAFALMGLKPETIERICGKQVRPEPRYPVEMVERILAALRGE